MLPVYNLTCSPHNVVYVNIDDVDVYLSPTQTDAVLGIPINVWQAVLEE